MSRLAALLFLMVLFMNPNPCHAQVATPVGGSEYPWYDFQNRVTLGARLEHRWIDSPILNADWGVGVAGSYALVPKWALTGKVLYRLGDDAGLPQVMEYDFGINFTFYPGK